MKSVFQTAHWKLLYFSYLRGDPCQFSPFFTHDLVPENILFIHYLLVWFNDLQNVEAKLEEKENETRVQAHAIEEKAKEVCF